MSLIALEEHYAWDPASSGNVVATWTIETMNGSGFRSVISQPDAALYIQPPILEMTVAPHTTAKLA